MPDGRALENETRAGVDQRRTGMDHPRASGDDRRKGGGQSLRLMNQNQGAGLTH